MECECLASSSSRAASSTASRMKSESLTSTRDSTTVQFCSPEPRPAPRSPTTAQTMLTHRKVTLTAPYMHLASRLRSVRHFHNQLRGHTEFMMTIKKYEEKKNVLVSSVDVLSSEHLRAVGLSDFEQDL